MKKLPFCLAGLAATLLSVNICYAASYTTKFLDAPLAPGNSSIPTAINNLGQVSGSFATGVTYPPHNTGGRHAALWNGTALTDLGPHSEFSGRGLAINGGGHVVGSVEVSLNTTRAAYWDNHGLTVLNTPDGAIASTAYGINSANVVVGDVVYANSQRAQKWVGGVLSELALPTGAAGSSATAVNDSGAIVGWVYSNSGAEEYAVRWDGDTATVLGLAAGDVSAAAAGINNAGQIFGSGRAADGSFHLTTWTADGVQILGGEYSSGAAINAAGHIVGADYDANTGYFAAMWVGKTEIDLNQYLDPALCAAGWRLVSANGINDKGDIVGQAENWLAGNANGPETRAFELNVSAVPEPEAYAMLLGGLAVLGGWARRRKIV